MVEASVEIGAAPIGRASPRLYGTLAEHLGRCCYNGLWVGPSSQIPNVEGLRTDAVFSRLDE
jgi:alpha-N-arabinofuranosidase